MRGRLTAGLLASSLVLAGPASATAAEHERSDLCVEVAAGVLDDEAWASLVAAMTAMAADDAVLFPEPTLHASGASDTGDATTRRLVIGAGHQGDGAGEPDGGCRTAELDWVALIGRTLLDVGADRLLAEAPTTPGIDSSVDIEWIPEETRLVTTLVFAGPLDIPNGTCWLDETLGVGPGDDGVEVASERGMETSPFAEGACGRFFDYLPDGGAAGQAATLLPLEIELVDGSSIRLVIEHVRVTEDGVELGGSIGQP